MPPYRNGDGGARLVISITSNRPNRLIFFGIVIQAYPPEPADPTVRGQFWSYGGFSGGGVLGPTARCGEKPHRGLVP